MTTAEHDQEEHIDAKVSTGHLPAQTTALTRTHSATQLPVSGEDARAAASSSSSVQQRSLRKRADSLNLARQYTQQRKPLPLVQTHSELRRRTRTKEKTQEVVESRTTSAAADTETLELARESLDTREQEVAQEFQDDPQKQRIYASMKQMLANAALRAQRLERVGQWVDRTRQGVERAGCCTRFACTLMLLFLVGVYVSSGVFSVGANRYAPLAPHLIDDPCYVVDFSSGQVHTQQYFNRSVYNYVRSVRHHLDAQHLIGLTAHHVGVPLCVLAFRNRPGQMRTLYNPKLVGESTEQTLKVKETDILCPMQQPVLVRRYKKITVEFDDASDDLVSGRDTSKAATIQMRETFDGSDAIILQHLIDVLSGHNACNRKQ